MYTTHFQRPTPFIAKAPSGVDSGTPWVRPFPDKRYPNGVMFAVDYTLMKLEDAVNFFIDWDTTPVAIFR